jgi:hypothetical protein
LFNKSQILQLYLFCFYTVCIIGCLLKRWMPEKIAGFVEVSWCLISREVMRQLGWVSFHLSFPSVYEKAECPPFQVPYLDAANL